MSKNQSALLCEAPIVLIFLGCTVEEQKYEDIACSVKKLSNLKIVPAFLSSAIGRFSQVFTPHWMQLQENSADVCGTSGFRNNF
jgi:hypothetical protein